MELDYNYQEVAVGNLEIENIGSFALEAHNDEGIYFYVVVQTVLGETTIATCGPVIPDIDTLFDGFGVNIIKIPFKENKILNIVSKYVNECRKAITTVELIDMKEAIDQFVDAKDFLMQNAINTPVGGLNESEED